MLNAVHGVGQLAHIAAGLADTAAVSTAAAVTNALGGLQNNDAFGSGLCQIIGCGASDDTAADNDYICCSIHGLPPSFPKICISIGRIGAREEAGST